MKKTITQKKVVITALYAVLFCIMLKISALFRYVLHMDSYIRTSTLIRDMTEIIRIFYLDYSIIDFLIASVCVFGVWCFVIYRRKARSKFRSGVEYGSARWGNQEDIKPFVDPVFKKNVILTQTESLMMSNRPKNPVYARNKNVLVIGGSGSGKTRFYVKPNLMQCHSSYCVTDPNGSL